ncbi:MULTISPECIES: toxin-antitoxin system TumE family protein [Thiorhodovibrio]|uniref:toxin-antitoxin system TumE family protein n=1 Tax=Thiorhodovibrio TaxID=61593 RepID=UPI001913B5A8|nr:MULTISPECIES: DUF6516 family protein [Thiorhodovibrio]MBK5970284.1 hypothetical protein [Thiorhodovibrio winogradskyi]WPL14853.1 hypothetical protein Thiosp_04709 [Thiorhodovibrio litoralis]
MLIDLIKRYSAIIQSWTVTNFDREGEDLRLKAQIVFLDGSQLHIRQIVIDGHLLKYAYQWQTQEGALIIRWDNAEHWSDVATFPHHKHVSRNEDVKVMPSNGAELALVLEEIALLLESVGHSLR